MGDGTPYVSVCVAVCVFVCVCVCVGGCVDGYVCEKERERERERETEREKERGPLKWVMCFVVIFRRLGWTKKACQRHSCLDLPQALGQRVLPRVSQRAGLTG